MTCADKIRKMSNENLNLLFTCIRCSNCTTHSLFDVVIGKYGESTAGFCANHSTCSECVKEALELEV